MSDDRSVFDRLRALLETHGVAYRHVQHAPTRTSEESATARGEPISIGAKALLLKVEENFGLFVLSADRQLDSKAIRRHCNAQRIRFATRDELRELTGLVPGCVPPFGEPVLAFNLHIDPSVFENDRVAFNAGSLTDSFILAREDYERVAKGTVFKFSQDGESARIPMKRTGGGGEG
ncbi:MAG: YbaK/EbsC family protein [Phycisphaerales bacterium]